MRFLVILLLSFFVGNAQEMPPVANFDAKTYQAGNQNWLLSQGKDKKIYSANNSGLLVYNGEQWSLFKVPGGSAVRSVLAIGNRVYTGSYMDFGYWEPDLQGDFNYTSLKGLFDGEIIDGEQFWHIKELDDYIVFQSLQRLYTFNKKTSTVGVLSTKGSVSNIFSVNDQVYYQVAEEGLFSIENGAQEALISNDIIKDKPLVGLCSFSENQLLAVTRDDGLFLIENQTWKPLVIDNYPLSESIYTALYLNSGELFLGTIGGGLYILNLNTSNVKHLSQPALINNTVLSLMEDSTGNIWVGLDNGLSVLYMASPFRLYTDTFGEIGTVYSSYHLNDILYLGTNQGLYYKLEDSENYSLVPGTSGQVWSLNFEQGKLYAGHDRGTFEITGATARLVWEGPGTWEVKALGNRIIQGHYNGISYLSEKVNDSIEYIKGFDLSSRNLVVESDSVVWVGHDHKGIFRLSLNKSNYEVESVKNYKVSYNEGLGLQVFLFENEVYYSTENNIYKFDVEKDKFTIDNKLAVLTEKQTRITGISEVLEDGTWWSFGYDNIYYVTKDAIESKLISRTVPLPIEYRGIAKGFENISLIDENKYLIGSNIGYISFELPLPKKNQEALVINRVESGIKGENFKAHNIDETNLSLDNEDNFVNFYFHIPNYGNLFKTKYSYRILDYSPGWSAWTTEASATLKNMPPGKFTFQVRGKLGDKITPIKSFKFSIARPWYLTNLAIALYVALLFLILFLIHKVYTSYYLRQRDKLIEDNRKRLEIEQLESQQEIMSLKNQKLEADVSAKNRELAASTMNIIKKNEFLTELKNKLQQSDNRKEVDEVISIINKNIGEKDNWNMFKEAFDNADKDFLQSVKRAHPSLTSNDLKLCAYLRLNLSSKEIAPLLNISVRSVEIKRYRLRKKMDLDREQGLSEYILTF